MMTARSELILTLFVILTCSYLATAFECFECSKVVPFLYSGKELSIKFQSFD